MVNFVDLNFQNTPRTIAAAVLHGADGVTLVDPGPASCLGALEEGLGQQGIALGDIRTLLLTHIHLDHAGASGSLVARFPKIRVFVHEVGAPHLVDPRKLLASATRLHGDRMDMLWGPFLPVPAERVHSLTGGERIGAGGRLRVEYTPGHAKHHVSYLDEETGTAYVGDTGGVCVGGEYLLAPTPPPDIDLDAWQRSLDTIDEWHADVLFLTHFGPTGPAHERLRLMRTRLTETAELAKASFGRGGTDTERTAWFVEELRRDARRSLAEPDARTIETAAPFIVEIWQGLARYWRKPSRLSV